MKRIKGLFSQKEHCAVLKDKKKVTLENKFEVGLQVINS